MHVKRVAVAGVVVEGWRELEVRNVREIKLCPDLPAEHECIGVRGELSLTAYWLRRCRARANWVCRVRIVINKLTKVCEDGDFYQLFRWRWWRHVFPILAVGSWSGFSATDGESVFPLLRQAFNVNVVVPYQARSNERVRKSATGQGSARETLITEISLSHGNAIVALVKRAVAVAGITAHCDIRRASARAGLQSESKEPVIKYCATQSQAQTVTFPFLLIPIIVVSRWLSVRIITGKPPAAVFVSQSHVTEKLQFGDRRKQFPFFSPCRSGTS